MKGAVTEVSRELFLEDLSWLFSLNSLLPPHLYPSYTFVPTLPSATFGFSSTPTFASTPTLAVYLYIKEMMNKNYELLIQREESNPCVECRKESNRFKFSKGNNE
jgi:hypothetical protein